MSNLVIASIDLGPYSPPRTEVNRSLRKMVYQPAAYNLDGAFWDFGKAEYFYHIFQTTDSVGYVTQGQKKQLETLFDNAESFSVVTDLLADDATSETFSAHFDYANPPRYQVKLLDGSLWAFVIPVYLKLNTP